MTNAKHIETIHRGLKVIQSCKSFNQLQVAARYAGMALHAAYYAPGPPMPPTLAVLFRDKIQEALDIQRDKIRAMGAPRLVRHERRKKAAC